MAYFKITKGAKNKLKAKIQVSGKDFSENRKVIYKTVYNVGILKQQIDLLKNISASYVMISHREPFLQKKQGVISWLENIYAMRVKNEPWIDAKI